MQSLKVDLNFKMESQRFSERMGFVSINRTLQIDSMSPELRNSIWNLIYEIFQSRSWGSIVEPFAISFLKIPVDQFRNSSDDDMRQWFRKYFFDKSYWHQVYDILEFLTEDRGVLETVVYPRHIFVSAVNEILEREYSGFRFIDGKLTPITDKAEISQIEETLAITQTLGLEGAHKHIQSSIQLFARRPNPDFLNSIKESISAVESVVKQIAGSNSSGLDGAMKALSSKVKIHRALQEGFLKLYGYSSDEGGIRHCLLEEPSSVGFMEAKFMLVSCSAFVHFLIGKAEKAGLLGEGAT